MSLTSASMLRAHGVLVTPQRLAVPRAVSSGPHCTTDQFAENVRSNIGASSRQAVYDALEILAKKNAIWRIESDGLSALYEDRVGDNHQDESCRIRDKSVDCAVRDMPCLTAVNNSGYRIDEAEVILWVTWPACLAAITNSAEN